MPGSILPHVGREDLHNGAVVSLRGVPGNAFESVDAADKNYQEEQARLYRPDGTKFYSDAEHKEQEARLQTERLRTARDVEQEVERAMAEARQELVNLQSEDPTKLLSTEELEGASARREFVNDDVMALSENDLASRLESVLSSGDRASMYLFWQAGRRKKAEIVESRGEQPFELNQVLENIQTALQGPSRSLTIAARKRSPSRSLRRDVGASGAPGASPRP